VKPKHFDFQNPKISTAVKETDDLFVVEVQSEAFAKFVKLDLSNADSLWSDNIFDLSASRLKPVTVQKNSLIKALSLVEFREQLTVHSLFDTYA
jgi:beta-mannosidase